MSKVRLRLYSLLALAAGLGAYPLARVLYPHAVLASGGRGPDGRLYFVSPTAGAWVLQWGLAAAAGLVLLSLVLFGLSFRKKYRE